VRALVHPTRPLNKASSSVRLSLSIGHLDRNGRTLGRLMRTPVRCNGCRFLMALHFGHFLSWALTEKIVDLSTLATGSLACEKGYPIWIFYHNYYLNPDLEVYVQQNISIQQWTPASVNWRCQLVRSEK